MHRARGLRRRSVRSFGPSGSRLRVPFPDDESSGGAKPAACEAPSQASCRPRAAIWAMFGARRPLPTCTHHHEPSRDPTPLPRSIRSHRARVRLGRLRRRAPTPPRGSAAGVRGADHGDAVVYVRSHAWRAVGRRRARTRLRRAVRPFASSWGPGPPRARARTPAPSPRAPCRRRASEGDRRRACTAAPPRAARSR